MNYSDDPRDDYDDKYQSEPVEEDDSVEREYTNRLTGDSNYTKEFF